MQMSIDAALITRKSASLDYNTDSLNASGKIWPRESVHSNAGIKAVGKSHGKPYYVLTSADAKGTAESAADLFKACVSEFAADGTNYSESIAEFFRAFAGVLDKSGYNSASCDLAIFAGVENRVFLAKSGKARLFRYSEGVFYEAKPQMFAYEDQASTYGVSSYSDVQAGDIFVLLSGKVGAVMSESLLKAIVKNADGDIKKMVTQIDSNAKKNGCTGAISAVVLKVTDVEGDENDAAPAVGAAAAAAAPSALREADIEEEEEALLPEEPEEEAPEEEPEEVPAEHHAHLHSRRSDYYDPSEEDIDEETEETEKMNRYKSRNKFGRAAIIDVVIVLAVIAVLVGVLAMKGVFNRKDGSALKEGGDIVNITGEQESTTKKNKKNSKNETTTKAEATTAAATTKKNSTTSNSGGNNTTRSSSGNNTPTRSTTSAPTEPPATQPTEAPPTEVTDPPTQIVPDPTQANPEPPTQVNPEPPTQAQPVDPDIVVDE